MTTQSSLFDKQEKLTALDELFRLSSRYHKSLDFYNLLNFISKFRSLSPFNAFLIHMQNRGVELVMSQSKWAKHKRFVKPDSRPLVILVPFGPVEFVYDIADTTGDPIPDYFVNPFITSGTLGPDVLRRSVANCFKENIRYKESLTHKASAGRASTNSSSNHYEITINSSYDTNTKYSTLVHELAHIYSGHLGVKAGCWWENRNHLSTNIEEIEAESISYLVCKRLGLTTTSESYLSDYIKQHDQMNQISLDVVLTVSNHIEQLGQKNFKVKKKK